jgi:hypothetical protein
VVVEIVWFFNQARWLPLLRLPARLACSAAMALRIRPLRRARSGWLAGGGAAATCADLATHHTTCIALLTHYFPGGLMGRGQALLCGGVWSARRAMVWWRAMSDSLGPGTVTKAALSSVLATVLRRSCSLANA